MERHTGRRIGGLLFVATLLVAGCGGGPSSGGGTAEADQNPVQGDWLIVGYDAEPGSMNPLLTAAKCVHSEYLDRRYGPDGGRSSSCV